MIFLGIFCILIYSVVILWFILGWRRLEKFHPRDEPIRTWEGVTVLVAFRNERDNLPQLVQLLSKQGEEKVEFLLLDDHSEDQPEEWLELPDDRFVWVVLPEHVVGKKAAIQFGVEKAKYSLVLTTDADCLPKANWIRSLRRYYERSTAFVFSMPVRMISQGRVFGILQSLDFLSLNAIGASAIGNSWPFLGNGANLAYLKSLFLEMRGYEGNMQFASGDDEFLIQKARAMEKEIVFIKDPDLMVETPAEVRLSSFLRQRKRWVSKSRHYQDRRITFVLVVAYLLACITVLGFFIMPKLGLALFCAKLIIDFSYLWLVSSFYRMRKDLVHLPFTQFLYLFYVIVIGAIGNFGGYQWKNRKVQ